MSAIQSDVVHRARAASTADKTNDESKTLSSHQKPNKNRFSALVQVATTKGHRKALSEGGLLDTTARDTKEEVTLRRTRSLEIAENRDTEQQGGVEATQTTYYQRAEDWMLSLVVDEDSLGDQLRIALIREPSSERKFLPRDKLDKLVTQKSVESELSRVVYLPTKILRHTWRSSIDIRIELPAEDNGARDSETRLIHPDAKTPLDRTCYKQIFAILLFMRRPRKIWSFVREGVSDADLPLDLQDDIFRLRRRGEVRPVIKCLKKRSDISQFFVYQWCVLAPFFREPDGRHDLHCKLSENQILPFTYWKDTGRRGGSGHVYKAIIHPNHHAFDEHEIPGNVVAVKKIFISNRGRDAFHELKVLQNLSKKRHAHNHLLKLLATYSQQHCLCLIFPWAEMDLDQYWRSTNPRSFRNDAALSIWLRQQCCGIAEAVSQIHRYKTLSGTTMLSNIAFPEADASTVRHRCEPNQSSGQRKLKTLFGRHGDIKPTNILWFPPKSSTEASTTPFGTLKLSDFGTAHFSDKERISSQDRDSVPNSRSYQSPESELPDGELSIQCDVWALGCVFLEFACWYFGGYERLKDFACERKSGRESSCFFLIKYNNTLGSCIAELNPPVIKIIENLRGESASNYEIMHVLNAVENDMLLILDDATYTEHNTDGTDIPVSSGLLGVTQQARRGRRKSPGNIARDLGSMPLSPQE